MTSWMADVGKYSNGIVLSDKLLVAIISTVIVTVSLILDEASISQYV